jgi:hypothetical protein
MRKFTILITLILVSVIVMAQESNNQIQSKNGYNVLPEAGDFALGFDAVPLLDFALNAVNIMNNTGQTAQHPGFVNGFNQVIFAKYFVSDKMAYRGKLGINTSRGVIKNYGNDPLNPSALGPENILLSVNKNVSYNYVLGFGLEYRRGHNRLQGFYGAEALIGWGATKTINNYEIEYDKTADDSGYVNVGDSRLLYSSTGNSLSLGLRAFGGVEYFIFPKISIAAEFGWGFGFVTNPRGVTETEYWGFEPGSTATDPYQFTEEVKGNTSGHGFGFSVDDGVNQFLGGSAALTLLFHF